MTLEELEKIKIPIGQAKDITGEKYGMLTPLFRVKNDKPYARTPWACQCDCGNYKIVNYCELLQGKTKSCGNHKSSDLTNKRFGNLVVKYQTPWFTLGGNAMWYCECDCGGHAWASTKILNSGKRVQCDDHIQNTMIGRHFGSLMPVEYMGVIDGSRYFTCLCDCGNIVHDVSSFYLLHFDNPSCGCIKINSIGEKNIKEILDQNGINYIQQKSFDTCRNPKTNRKLFFDFSVLSGYNFLLEFDGKQHDGPRDEKYFNQDDYEDLKYRDMIKNQWCYDNDIVLKRIPYSYRDIMTIDDILSDKFIINPKLYPDKYFYY